MQSIVQKSTIKTIDIFPASAGNMAAELAYGSTISVAKLAIWWIFADIF